MKTTIITGASGNLGKAATERFISAGHKVLATVTPGRTLGYETSGNVQTYQVDLTSESATNEFIQKAIAEHQRIDNALLLVGGFAPGNITATDGATLRKMMSLNFETAFFIIRPLFEHMVANKGGRIILISSKTSLINESGKNFLAYSLSKSLLVRLAEYLNAEGAPHDVVCSVVAPSTIDTPENRKSMPSADFSKWVPPSQLADSIYFLTSEAGSALREPVLKVYGKS